MALAAQPDALDQRILLVGVGPGAVMRSSADLPRPPGRRWRTIWRMAFSCRRVLSTRSVRSVSISARKRARTVSSRVARSSPGTASRVAMAISSPGGDGQHAAAHGAIVPRAVAALPAHDTDREAGQEIGVARQDPETAGGVFGAQRRALPSSSMTTASGVVMRSLMTRAPFLAAAASF